MKKTILALGLCLVLFLSGCHVVEEEERKKSLEYTISNYDHLPTELQEVIDSKKEQPFQITYTNRDYLFIVIGYGKQQLGKYGIQVKQLYALRSGYYIQTELVGKNAETDFNKKSDGTSDSKKEIVYTPYIVVKTKRLLGKYSDELHIIR